MEKVYNNNKYMVHLYFNNILSGSIVADEVVISEDKEGKEDKVYYHIELKYKAQTIYIYYNAISAEYIDNSIFIKDNNIIEKYN